MVYDVPDANRIMQLAPGFRAASKGFEASCKDSARSCNTRAEFPLFASYLVFVSRPLQDRTRASNQDLFSSPAIYFFGVYESSAGCSSWNDIGIIFVSGKQNVGVAHASQLEALSGWASPVSHGPSIEPGQCGIQNCNGSMDIGAHGGDSHGAFGLRLPLPPKDCGTPAGTTALYALTACA